MDKPLHVEMQGFIFVYNSCLVFILPLNQGGTMTQPYQHAVLLAQPSDHDGYSQPIIWKNDEGERRLNFTLRLTTKDELKGDIPRAMYDKPQGVIYRHGKEAYVFKAMLNGVEQRLGQLFDTEVKHAGSGGSDLMFLSFSDPYITRHLEALFADAQVPIVYRYDETAQPQKLDPAQYPHAPETYAELMDEINGAASRAARIAMDEISKNDKGGGKAAV
jgi:hypothetical protein